MSLYNTYLKTEVCRGMLVSVYLPCIKPPHDVPRFAGGSSGEKTHAVTRTPPSHSVCLPPFSGAFVA